MRSRATSILLAGLVVAGLTGCTFGATQATRLDYDPSDGIGAEVGNVQVRNALLVTEDGETASLAVNLINSGNENVQMTVSWEAEAGRVDRNVSLRAGSTQSLGADASPIVLSGVEAAPGSLFPVFFQYGDNEGQELMVPVLDGALAEYAELVP